MSLPIFPTMFCSSGERRGCIGGEGMWIVRHKLVY